MAWKGSFGFDDSQKRKLGLYQQQIQMDQCHYRREDDMEEGAGNSGRVVLGVKAGEGGCKLTTKKLFWICATHCSKIWACNTTVTRQPRVAAYAPNTYRHLPRSSATNISLPGASPHIPQMVGWPLAANPHRSTTIPPNMLPKHKKCNPSFISFFFLIRHFLFFWIMNFYICILKKSSELKFIHLGLG